MNDRSLSERRRALLQTLAAAENGATDAGAADAGAAAMRANIELLRKMQPARPPKALVAPDFLASIYVRAVEETCQVGDLLTHALPPKLAPDQAVPADAVPADAVPADAVEPGSSQVWELDGLTSLAEREAVGVLVADGLPTRAAPGWLWSRIRADVRDQLAERRKPRMLYRWTAAAAAVLLATTSLLMVFDVFPGTQKASEIVIEVERVDQPLGDPFLPGPILRQLSR